MCNIGRGCGLIVVDTPTHSGTGVHYTVSCVEGY